jgi:hypothetical protein
MLAALNPFAAAGRALRRRCRGDALRLTLHHRRRNGVSVVLAELAAPLGRTGELAAAVATVAGDVAVRCGRTVGTVGIAPDEEPLLVARAPRRDLVAEAFERALLTHSARLSPVLWVALERSHYLAEVAPPYTPYQFDEQALLGHVSGGTVRLAVLVSPSWDAAEWRLRLTVYGFSPDVRAALSAARKALKLLPRWERSREAAPAPPSSVRMARLHR